MIKSFNPPDLSRFQTRALIVGVAGLVLLLIGAFINREEFFQAYLIGFAFWTGIAVGSLALLMLQHLTGGGWGFVIRRILEASTRTIPLVAALFIPVIIGAHSLYEWTHAEVLIKNKVIAFKQPYLNLSFFTIRGVICLAVWFLLAYFFNKWSLAQDRSGERSYTKNMQMLSGPGMVLLIFTVTFAAVDWFMSLEAEWFSTIYGLLFVAAWTLSALAFTITVLATFSKSEPLNQIVAPLHFHDLGKLLLALVMLWAYFSYSQFLVIWSANLPEEIHYYLKRNHGPWNVIIIAIVILHFAAPFLFLLSRSLKRNPRTLVMIAGLVLVMRMIDLYPVLVPAFSHTDKFHFSWMYIVAPFGIGGIWLWYFFRQLGKRAMIPINDPQFESVMEQQHATGH